MLLYNTLYNVSITQPGICGQPNQTSFIKLSYSKYLLIGENYACLSHNVMTCYVGKCDDPLELNHSDVIAEGYEDPALEGENITFTCLSEAILCGSNSSTCMENGEWEPDPSEVECTRELVTTGTTVPSMPLNSLHTMHIVHVNISDTVSKIAKIGAYPFGIHCLPPVILLINNNCGLLFEVMNTFLLYHR